MSELKRIVYLSNEQAQTLFGTGSVTSNGITVNYDENDLYVTPDTQLQADWEQTVTTADDYIKNKPPLGSAASATVATTVGNNANLPTGAAIQAYIASLGYSTTTGTVTSVKPGNGLINGTSGTSQTAITGSGTISIGEGKVTNAMLAGSITPAKLDSSATITIGTQSVKVGGSFTSSTLISDLGVSPSMTILSYGNSTWQDFLTAYNNNSIVYCRASSSSNPASGSQTRMAFMAYVNNETNPTEVEFQYYRSVSSHNASILNDEVYVYKLNSTGNWSVTTRKASVSQIKAGTNISVSYSSSNNSVTVNNTQTVPAASSTTPAALGTAAVGTSDDYARADHVHAKPTPADIGAAPLASPALTGTPTAPTAAAGTNTTQIATTEFVTTLINSKQKLLSFSITTSNWTSTAGLYVYTISDSFVTENTAAIVNMNNSYDFLLSNLQVITGSGTVTFSTGTIPSNTISGVLVLQK